MDLPYRCRAEDGTKQHSLFQTLNNDSISHVTAGELGSISRPCQETNSEEIGLLILGSCLVTFLVRADSCRLGRR